MKGGINLYAYVDSVGKPSIDTNLYAYTGNNPLNFIDPLGLDYINGGIIYSDDGQIIGELGLESPLIDPIDLIPIGTAAVKAPKAAKACSYVVNHNRYLRIGWGRMGGNRVFRLSGEWVQKFNKFFRNIDNSHINLWKGGPL